MENCCNYMGSREPVMSFAYAHYPLHNAILLSHAYHYTVCTISDEYKMLSTSENMLHAEQYSEHEVLDR